MVIILNEIRSSLGMQVDDTAFDYEILGWINQALSVVSQVLTKVPTVDSVTTFDDIKPSLVDSVYDVDECMNLIEAYLRIAVRLGFDTPPRPAYEVYHDAKMELIWRIFACAGEGTA